MASLGDALFVDFGPGSDSVFSARPRLKSEATSRRQGGGWYIVPNQ
jgi:hypothetical protein